MISAFHRLRRDEEGQTLVLAAIFGLVLCLCVLGTVNVGRAVYDKMQLQTAADNAAYSQAAVAARVMNFTAYTNRAMVVHYASIMAMSAYLTYFHYLYGYVEPALKALSFVPYVGPIFQTVKQILDVLLQVLDAAVAIVTPLVAAANVVLYGLQEGAWYSFMARLLSLPPEANSGDSIARPYRPLGGIWSTAINLANQASWALARGHALMPQNTYDSFRIMLNANDPVVQQARMHMVEIANSARSPWVAYGDRAQSPSLSPLGRHWWWGGRIGPVRLGIGTVARTELGSFAPGGIVSTIAQGAGQVWSANRLQAVIRAPIIGTIDLALFSVVTMDKFFPTSDYSYALDTKSGGGGIGRILSRILGSIFGGLGVFTAMKNEAQTGFNQGVQTRIFWISPYVHFVPRASAKGTLTKNGNFNQPDFIIGLNKPAADYDNDPGASRVFGRRFVSRLGGAQGVTDFRLSSAAALPTLPQGMNALSAAQVYYHRPGDWKEMPNLFNPLWGARLMPVLESNAAARIPALQNNAIVRQFLVH